MIDFAQTFVITVINPNGSVSMDVDPQIHRFVSLDDAMAAELRRTPFHRGDHLATLWDRGVAPINADIRRPYWSLEKHLEIGLAMGE